MKRLLSLLFGRKRQGRVVELHRLMAGNGRRLDVSEVVAALSGQTANPQVQALVQVLIMQRGECLEASQADAWRRQDPSFQLGGLQAMDDLLMEVAALLEGKPSDSVKKWFDGQ